MTTIHSALRTAFVAFAFAALSPAVPAAGLGPIKVYSGLGQNLRAEIEISATPAELQSLSARIASLDAFRQAGVPYSPTVARIDVQLDPDPQRPLLRLSSSRPIDDPYVGLLVEIDWAAGNLAREYTFLLDPVELVPAPAPAPAAAAAVAPPTQAAATPALPAATPAPVAAPPAPQTGAASPAAVATTAAAPRSYQVRRGDTLHRIASNHLPRGVTLDQMLIALHRANRAAFEADNINLLNSGAVLVLPDAAQARAIDAGEARRAVRAQAVDFQAYRRSLAATAARAPARTAAAAQHSSGRIVPRVDDATATRETADRVQVSRSREALPATADARLQAMEEELSARERALEDSNERLDQLEQAVRDLQKLLELRGSPAGVPAAVPDAAASADASVAADAGATAADAEADVAAPAAAAPVGENAAPPSAANEEPDAATSAAESASVSDSAAAAEPAPVPAVADRAERTADLQPAADPAAGQGLLQQLIAQPLLAAGLGGMAALLLLGLGFVLGRAGRRSPAVLAPAAPPDGEHQTLFAATGAAEVDAGSSVSVDTSQAGMSSLNDDDGVDPVAEADVYMAYGRDAQAEEILRDALAVDPARAAIYLKLLEIHAQRGEVAAFEQVARPLHQLTDGAGWDWEKAAAMGRKLDPGNPLYAERNAEGDTLAPRTVVPAAVAGAAAASFVSASEEVTLAPDVDEPASREELVHTLSDLDFTSSRVDRPMTEVAPGAAEAAGDAMEFDIDEIDLDLGGDEEFAVSEANTEAPVEPAPVTLAGADEVDLALDFDAGDANDASDVQTQPAADEVAPPAEPASELSRMAAELDFELPELEIDSGASSFDLSATVVGAAPQMEVDTAARAAEAAAASAVPAAAAELGDFDFDIDAAAPLTMAAPPAAPKPALAGGVDLSDITLDLDNLDEAPTPVKAARARAAAAAASTAGADPEASALDATMIEPIAQAARAAADAFDAADDGAERSDEFDTKLELARAYEDMGDREGALELIEEVMREGTASQLLAAREIQQRLG